MITLAKHFHTRIIVNQQRYEWLQCMDGVDIDLFSVNESEGWIEVARRNTTHNSSKIVTIQLTGWANIQNYVTTDNMNYLVPYSLHSNYLELEYFVRGVQPAVLKTVVSNEHAKSEKVNRISQYSSYMITISHLK
jgi:DNA cross-link repair 1B protein